MSDYWQRRQAQIMYEGMEDAEKTAKEIADLYAKATREINYQIGEIFDRFVDKHDLSEEEAKRLLGMLRDPADIQSLMDRLKADPKNAELLAELESPAYRARIERLENLQTEIDRMMQDVYTQEKVVSSEHYANVFNNAYYRNIYEIQRAAGFQFSFSTVDFATLNQMLAMEFLGSNYSKRIWKNTDALAKDVKEQLILGFLTGKTESDMAAEIANKYATGSYAARRLIRTESNFQATQGQKLAYEDADLELYQIVATLDLRTSKICREMDGKVFPVAKMQSGENAPPFHPFCRTTTVAYFEDDDLATLKRRARNPLTGENELVSADTTYAKWYEKNVAHDPKAQAVEKAIRNWGADQKQYERYKQVLGKSAGKTFADFQEMKYNKPEEWADKKALYRKTNAYNREVANEPAITEALKKIAEANKLKMEGIENRIKTKASYLRKINKKTRGSTDPKIIKGITESANDTIRYTYMGEPEKLVDNFETVSRELRDQGYTLIDINNTWLDEKNPYNGLNTTFAAPNGQKFEIQFHTPESLRIKEEMHKLYEEQRLETTPPQRKVELMQQMADMAEGMQVPAGIEKIK